MEKLKANFPHGYQAVRSLVILPGRFKSIAKHLLWCEDGQNPSLQLFGVGKIPAHLRATIESEGVTLIDEGIPGTVTYRDFRSPGRIASWKKSAFRGAIALTRTRLLALQFSSPVINVPLDDERLQQMQFSIEGEGKILIAFNANLFHNDWSGTLEYRFRTPQAQAFVKSLRR